MLDATRSQGVSYQQPQAHLQLLQQRAQGGAHPASFAIKPLGQRAASIPNQQLAGGCMTAPAFRYHPAKSPESIPSQQRRLPVRRDDDSSALESKGNG